jgi:hypothetical protein
MSGIGLQKCTGREKIQMHHAAITPLFDEVVMGGAANTTRHALNAIESADVQSPNSAK